MALLRGRLLVLEGGWNIWINQLLVVLDMRRMEFSFVNIPHDSLHEYSAIAEAEDGTWQLWGQP